MKHSSKPENRHINTSIRTYRHTATRKRVTLAGVIHVAQDPNYYPTIQNILDTEEEKGAAVHYERIKYSTPEEVRNARPANRYLQRLRRLKAALDLPYLLAGGINIVKQRDEIVLRDTWENHDATILELVRELDPPALFALGGLAKLGTKLFTHLGPEQRLEVLSGIDPDREHSNTNLLMGRLAPAILDYRNDIALRAYDDLQVAEPGRDAALLWGMGHLQGLGEGLESRGFTQIDEQRLLAIDMSALKLVEHS